MGKRILGVGAFLLALVLIGAFYVWRSSQNPVYEPLPGGSGSTSPGATSSTEPVSKGGEITLYFDGWSQKILSKVGLTYTPDKTDADPRAMAWAPLSAEELSALGKAQPDLVARLVSRMVTSNQDLTCSESGCTSSSGELTYDEIANPGALDGLGGMYEDQGVRYGVWKADLQLPEGVMTARLGADGWQDFTVAMTSEQGAQGGLEEGEQIKASAENGYLKAMYPISAGLGRIFVTEPAWLGENPVSYVRAPGSGVEMDAESVRAALKEPLFAQGLATPSPYAKGLSSSQLTYMTSPSTGCGVAVICVPDTVETTFEDYNAEAVKVCSSATDLEAVAVIENSYWSFTLPGRVSMGGLWQGKTAKDFADQGSSVIYTGVPPLADGEQRLRVNVVRIFSTENGALVETTQSGQVAQNGYDSEDAMKRSLNQDVLSNAFSGEYSPC